MKNIFNEYLYILYPIFSKNVVNFQKNVEICNYFSVVDAPFTGLNI